MVIYEYFVLRNHVLEEVKVQSKIVAESVAAAMAFRDEAAANETLSALHGSEDMIEAHLLLPDGTLFRSYYHNTKMPPYITNFHTITSDTEKFTLSTITIEKTIYLRKQFVGSLILVNSLRRYYESFIWYVCIIIITSGFGFLLARWIAVRISHTITGPLTSLTNMTEKIMREKDYTTSITIDTKDEVGSLSYAFSEMMLQIRKRDLSLQQLAYYDRITGLANRHYFEERIVQAIENAKRYGTVCYLFMIDLDDFKIVNDTMGHYVGDLLLQHVSESLTNIMRQNDTIYRIGGDEFAIIIENKSNLDQVEKIAQKIIQTVSTPVILDGHKVKVGASIGISSFPEFSTDVKTLMTTADAAMYVAKGQGKNSYKKYG